MAIILSYLERLKFDTKAVQELWWDGSGSLKTQEMITLYSGREKYDRGVVFVIKKSILPNIVKFDQIKNRICYVELKGKWFNILINNYYDPIYDKSEEIKNAFYKELDRICDALLTVKPKIIFWFQRENRERNSL